MGKTPERITASNVKNVAGAASTKKKTKEEISSPYQCDICGKRVKNKAGLISHMQVHGLQTVETIEEETKEAKKEDPRAWVTQYARKGRVTDYAVVDKLAGEERIAFLINESQETTKGFYEAGINGQDFLYPVEKYIELPKTMVEHIKQQYRDMEKAKKTNLVSRSDDVRDALTR